MAAVEEYRQHIQRLLSEHAQLVWDSRIQAETIFDQEHDRYQLVYVGWRDSDRVYGVVLHLDIIDGKIWVQQDGTEVGIANKLVEIGVPKHDIVLGIDPPKMRQYTEFAVG
ncbi:XisI protein [Scytonema sp. HK-05]|uniref:XisI protein n=1 Tax=Scytonema sp. HK-05 TaxID=1137095 RepID=UPI000937E547|nr:XisI protein [Scytonema sp. HK-05]OKH48281.1 XisI protein [Scytonema sp. HK-05]BAY47739.1 XisI protein [Scytonema sp. HK-05]